MSKEEFREAVIQRCKKEYKSFCEKWAKEFNEAIEYFDNRGAFDGEHSEKEIAGMAYGLMMSI